MKKQQLIISTVIILRNLHTVKSSNCLKFPLSGCTEHIIWYTSIWQSIEVSEIPRVLLMVTKYAQAAFTRVQRLMRSKNVKQVST